MTLKSTLETASNIKYDIYLDTLNEDTIRQISLDQKEPERMLQHRLKCLKIYNELPMPKY
jgi:hypothetical protein